MHPQEQGELDSELDKGFQVLNETDFSVDENVELSIKLVDTLT